MVGENYQYKDCFENLQEKDKIKWENQEESRCLIQTWGSRQNIQGCCAAQGLEFNPWHQTTPSLELSSIVLMVPGLFQISLRAPPTPPRLKELKLGLIIFLLLLCLNSIWCIFTLLILPLEFRLILLCPYIEIIRNQFLDSVFHKAFKTLQHLLDTVWVTSPSVAKTFPSCHWRIWTRSTRQV